MKFQILIRENKYVFAFRFYGYANFTNSVEIFLDIVVLAVKIQNCEHVSV
jgi:hypothetical protein